MSILSTKINLLKILMVLGLRESICTNIHKNTCINTAPKTQSNSVSEAEPGKYLSASTHRTAIFNVNQTQTSIKVNEDII